MLSICTTIVLLEYKFTLILSLVELQYYIYDLYPCSIGGNCIDDFGTLALTEGLKHCTSLSRLM